MKTADKATGTFQARPFGVARNKGRRRLVIGCCEGCVTERLHTAAILFLFLILSFQSIAQIADADLAAGLRLLDEGRTTLSDSSLNDAWRYFEKIEAKNPTNAVLLYNLGRVDYYRCNAAAMRGNHKGAEVAIDRAIEEVQQALKLDDHSPVAHSLLADLYGRKIGLGGFMAGPRLGPKVKAENARAAELDGSNARVLAALGRQYLMAPKMFGGDVEQAITSFRKSAQSDPTSDETFAWLAFAYRKKGDKPSADAAVGEALRLNPRSVFAQGVKAGKFD